VLLKNVDPSAETTVSFVAASTKPRVEKWNIVPGPEKTIKVGLMKKNTALRCEDENSRSSGRYCSARWQAASGHSRVACKERGADVCRILGTPVSGQLSVAHRIDCAGAGFKSCENRVTFRRKSPATEVVLPVSARVRQVSCDSEKGRIFFVLRLFLPKSFLRSQTRSEQRRG
jgi:hypothetical protein